MSGRGTSFQYGTQVSLPDAGCNHCSARPVIGTQFDLFMAALRYYWNGNHDGLGKASGDFWKRSAKQLSGFGVGNGSLITMLGVSALEARSDITRGQPPQEIRGGFWLEAEHD